MISKSKAKVVVTRRLPAPVETRMMELFDVTLNDSDTPYSKAQLMEAVEQADILVPTVTDIIDADILRHAGSQLDLIANFGAGTDHIDLTAAHQRGILVTNTPDVLTQDTADLTMALILSVPRRLAEGDRLVRSGKWDGWGPTNMLGHRIHQKRLGIIGMGRIGQAIAKRAKAFNMSIHYHNRNQLHPETEADLEATYWESLDQMLRRMDIISVNCPNTPATYHLLSKRRLELLPEHCYLINTSRGQVIDEDALADRLKANKLAGAGLDVFEHEPTISKKLLKLDNVTLLPHIGSATIEFRQAMGERVLINMQSYMDGHTPPNRVLEALTGF